MLILKFLNFIFSIFSIFKFWEEISILIISLMLNLEFEIKEDLNFSKFSFKYSSNCSTLLNFFFSKISEYIPNISIALISLSYKYFFKLSIAILSKTL